VGIGIVVLATLALVARALNHVPEMRDHAGLDDALAIFIKVDPPRIARALGEHFEELLRRMITPHRGVDALALLNRGAGLANERRTENPVATVEPAVRSPG